MSAVRRSTLSLVTSVVCEIRHQVDGDGELQIGLAVHHLLHIAHRLDAGGERGLELIVVDRLLAAFIDRLLDDFAHHATCRTAS